MRASERNVKKHSTSIDSLLGDGDGGALPAAPPSVYRSNSWRFWGLLVVAALLGPTLWGVVTISIGGRTNDGDPHPIAVRLTVVALAAIGVLVAVRIARAGVALDDRGVTVRSVFRDRRVAWSDVDKVVLASARVSRGKGHSGPGARIDVETTDGRTLKANATLIEVERVDRFLGAAIAAFAAKGFPVVDRAR